MRETAVESVVSQVRIVGVVQDEIERSNHKVFHEAKITAHQTTDIYITCTQIEHLSQQQPKQLLEK